MTNTSTKLPINISLVIPVYNNEKTIQSKLEQCEAIMHSVCSKYEILISNDASTDKTKKYLDGIKNPYIKIFNQKNNLGISKNIRFLYEKAHYEYILLFSIDGAWDTNDIKKLAYAVYNNKADIIIGRRRKKAYTLFRHLISFFYNGLTYAFFGVKTYDAGSIKIFKKNLLQKIKLLSQSIFFEAELIMKAQKHGYKIGYVDISHTLPNKKTKSGVNYSLIWQSSKDLFNVIRKGI